MGEVLELGCGEGHIARLLAGKGYRVTGVDISPTAIQWAKEKTLDTGLHVEYLEIYLSIVQKCWPSLDLTALQQMTIVGHFFRRLAAIYWSSLELKYQWLEKPVESMRIYHDELSQTIQLAPWAVP